MGGDIDTILGPVAEAFRGEADTLLDLRKAALQQRDAGLCLRCYFKIRERSTATPAPARKRRPLAGPRAWVERTPEIVARDHSLSELERLPVRIETDDLESFCEEVMREFQENRAYEGDWIELSVAFKEDAAPAR